MTDAAGGSIEDAYRGREATEVKHLILRRYLEKLAYKIGHRYRTITYVDGFAGPWRSGAQDFSDTSPHIAISALQRARDGLARVGQRVEMRCIFCERDAAAVSALRASTADVQQVRVTAIHGEFLGMIGRIVSLTEGGRQPRFTFVFVDPTGWTRYDPAQMMSLLQPRSTEVLVNFMTKDIIRFVDHPDESIRRSFDPLFETPAHRLAWRGLKGKHREDAILGRFVAWLKRTGNFEHVVSSVVLNPRQDRTHFHLVFGTHSNEGLLTFRDIEVRTLPDQLRLRREARKQEQGEGPRQPELFQTEDIVARTYLDHLEEQARNSAWSEMDEFLRSSGDARYDDLVIGALHHPFVSEQTVKERLRHLKSEGAIAYLGLGPRDRIPKFGRGHLIEWTAP